MILDFRSRVRNDLTMAWWLSGLRTVASLSENHAIAFALENYQTDYGAKVYFRSPHHICRQRQSTKSLRAGPDLLALASLRGRPCLQTAANLSSPPRRVLEFLPCSAQWSVPLINSNP
jgi:hypothetical protein